MIDWVINPPRNGEVAGDSLTEGSKPPAPPPRFGGPPPRSGEDFYRISHCRVSSRPTIIRMTWLVPSRIEWTRRSRQKRSIG